MSFLRITRHLMLLLASIGAMLVAGCHDDGLIDPPDDNDNDSCCASLVVTVGVSRTTATLAGVSVALRKGMDVVDTKLTDSNGVATFSNVCSADYNLRLTRDGYAVAERDGLVIERCDTTSVQMTMMPRGTDPNDDTCCSSQLRLIPTDEQGNPLSGAQVKITLPNGTYRTMESTLDGVRFRELCRGAYGIRIARDGYKVHESRIELGCNVEKTERLALVRAGSEPNDTCCNARLVVIPRGGPNGGAIEGATVKLWQGGRIIRSMITSVRGVVFENLCEGHYGISIHKEGYAAKEIEETVKCERVTELMPELVRMLPTECCDNVAIIKLLDERTHRPVAEQSVMLAKDGKVVATMRTNAEGVARFTALCEGKYMAVIERANSRTAAQVEVLCRIGAEVTLRIPAGEPPPNDTCCNAAIRLRVLDGASNTQMGLMGAHVIVKLATRAIATVETNRDGYAAFDGLCGRRTYVIVLEKEGFQRMAIELPIGECRVYEKTVRMLPN